ncbi:E3 ubiquitin-protein ligase TRIM65 [Pituophis catenifer annectens]|uniref:E3 ubiquitin-protein ligase TRIM65 n=1 Tax=Pituophis catenifer annectens TaxID=94852 RepID=UPI0039955352
MASSESQKLEEKLICCICLDVFTTPVTVPCGHSFCEKCINSHWDKEEQGLNGQKIYTCPECRQCFPERPKLSKTVLLENLVELLKQEEVLPGASEGEIRKAAGSQARQCANHGRPLELYCVTEKRCICCVCTVRSCQKHQRALFEEGRKAQEESIKKTLEEKRKEAERITAEIQKLEQQMNHVSVFSMKFKSGILQKFDHLTEILKECQKKVSEMVTSEHAALLKQMQENRNCLQHHLETVTQYNRTAEGLMSSADDIVFLEEQHLLSPPTKLEVPPVIQLDLDKNANTVTKFFTEFFRLLETLQSNLLNPQMGDRKIKLEPKVFVKRMSEPCLSENELRTKLLKDQQNLTFDPITANKYLQITDNNQKATHPQVFQKPKPNDPQRFEPWQVMCTQNFSQGTRYWEVELSDHSVIVGVACKTFTRLKQAHQKFTIGLDKLSWGLHIQEDSYMAWYNDKSTKIKEPLCKFIGVLLDCDQGTISFYSIENNMKCLHVFHTTFTEPLVPIFWLCEGTAVTLCQRPPSQIISDERSPDLQV